MELKVSVIIILFFMHFSNINTSNNMQCDTDVVCQMRWWHYVAFAFSLCAGFLSVGQFSPSVKRLETATYTLVLWVLMDPRLYVSAVSGSTSRVQPSFRSTLAGMVQIVPGYGWRPTLCICWCDRFSLCWSAWDWKCGWKPKPTLNTANTS